MRVVRLNRLFRANQAVAAGDDQAVDDIAELLEDARNEAVNLIGATRVAQTETCMSNRCTVAHIALGFIARL